MTTPVSEASVRAFWRTVMVQAGELRPELWRYNPKDRYAVDSDRTRFDVPEQGLGSFATFLFTVSALVETNAKEGFEFGFSSHVGGGRHMLFADLTALNSVGLDDFDEAWILRTGNGGHVYWTHAPVLWPVWRIEVLAKKGWALDHRWIDACTAREAGVLRITGEQKPLPTFVGVTVPLRRDAKDAGVPAGLPAAHDDYSF